MSQARATRRARLARGSVWHVDDAPEVLGLIESEVIGLAARLVVR